ncbi:MAG TPA: hypothetical protein PLV92_17615, partial [Pirellulaceae bacterium]|nr:hypothetical protein [Pirellulaceae bacterium]
PGAAFVAEAKDRRRVRRPSAPPTQVAPAAGSTEQQEAMFRMALKERYEFQEPDANAKSLLIAVEILTCDSRTWDRITDGQLANERASVWDRTRLSRIMTQLEADRHTNRLYAPRVVVFEGKTAQVQSVNQRPFVVGFEDSASVPGDKDRDAKAKPRPIVKIFEEGVRIELCGRRESDELIELQFKATHGSVAGVTTSRDAADREIQIPQLNESRVDTSVRLTEKQAFVCAGGVQQRADGASERIVYIVRCESVKPTPRDSNDSKATPARAAVEPTSGLTSPRDLGALRLYAVADLVVPIPRTAELDIRTSVAESPSSRTTSAVPALPMAADFEPLVKLIKSTVNPSGWQPEGSCEIQTQVDRMALVVRADAQTHDMVADLLTQLRRLQDVQVAYETVLLSPNEKLLRTAKEERWPWNEANRVDAGPPIAALDEAGAARLREQIASGEINVLQTPKITVFNGQGMRFKLQSDAETLRPASPQTPNRSPAAAVSDRSVDAASVKAKALEPKTPHDLTVRFATVVSSDRRNLRLTLAVGEQAHADEVLGGVAIREIKDAQTIVVDLSGEQMSTEWKDWKERGPLAQSPEGQAVLRSLVARQARQPLWLVLRPRVLILVDEAWTSVRTDVISPSGELEFAPAARP